jgi:chaperone modulatory protein CbpM
MIDIEAVFTQVSGLDAGDLERWILNAWVRPAGDAGRYKFREIDVARVRLILELRDELQVNEDALPVVLLLLDQLHDLRRRMREVSEVIAVLAPQEMRREMLMRLVHQSGKMSGSFPEIQPSQL